MEAILVLCAAKMLAEKKARDYGEIFLLCLMILAAYGMLSTGKIFILYCLGIALSSLPGSFSPPVWPENPNEAIRSGSPTNFLNRLAHSSDHASGGTASLFHSSSHPYPDVRAAHCIVQPIRNHWFFRSGSLRRCGPIQGSEQLVFRAQMPPLTQTPYWRGTVMDVFHGDQWNGSELSANEGAFLIDPNKEEIRQDIFMEPAYHRYFFALDVPFAIEGVTATQEGGAIFKNPLRLR